MFKNKLDIYDKRNKTKTKCEKIKKKRRIQWTSMTRILIVDI